MHVLVRKPDSSEARRLANSGAHVFGGDYEDVEAINTALEGVTAVFFNPPYPGPDFLQACKVFLRTCAEHATVKTLVLSSAAGTEKYQPEIKVPHAEYWAIHAEVEDLARSLSFENLIILRPPFLMHGYLLPASTFIFPQLAIARKMITSLRPQTKVPHLRAEDVGIFASAVLRNPSAFHGRAINMAAENLMAREVCNIMGEASGVKIDLQDSVGNTGSPLQGYHDWANSVDASIDVAALREEFGDGLMDLRSFLIENQADLLKS